MVAAKILVHHVSWKKLVSEYIKLLWKPISTVAINQILQINSIGKVNVFKLINNKFYSVKKIRNLSQSPFKVFKINSKQNLNFCFNTYTQKRRKKSSCLYNLNVVNKSGILVIWIETLCWIEITNAPLKLHNSIGWILWWM